MTLFCEVEAIINNRPITAVSTDAKDQDALTPSHLLTAGAVIEPPLEEHFLSESYHRCWKHIQFLADRFWNRWVKEYLPLLCLRQKHLHHARNLKVNDLVLITRENRPRNQWPLGRIMEAPKDDDGVVRRVQVKTSSGEYLHPAVRICLLEGAH